MKTGRILFISVLGLLLASCSPKPEQLKKVIEEHPDIVFSAIQKDPEQFIKVVNEAARVAQTQAQDKAAKEEKTKRDEEFKNPLTPELGGNRAFRGNKDAAITIVEYSDFQCPYCRRGAETVHEVLKQYGDKVRFVFKNLPLEFHPQAMPAATIFEAIKLQDAEKAYKFHDEVFENQKDLGTGGVEWLKGVAKKLGINMKKLEDDMKSDKVKQAIEADIAEAKKFGFSGTPGYLINGVSLRGAYPASEFKEIIDRHLSAKK